MSARALALVVVKILGIYFLFASLSWLVTMLQLTWTGGASGSERLGLVMPASFGVVGLAIATVMLVHTSWVVRLLFRESEFETVKLSPDPGFLATGLALLGAWLLAQSIPALVSRATVFLGLIVGDHQTRFQEWWRENWFDMVYFAAELLVGLLLFTRNQRLARVATRIEASPT